MDLANPTLILAVIALVLAIVSFFVERYPLVTVAVILLAIALILPAVDR